MLTNLHVENLAIIDKIDIEFKDGLTVITGETGAGKSLIIDAISLLMGERATVSLVRTNQNKAIIEGIFDNISDEAINILNELEIDNDGLLTLRREIYANGKSLYRVNGISVNLNIASNLCESLIDIHEQSDTLRLFDAKNYLSFIDDDEIKAVHKEYSNALKEYLTVLKEYNKILNRQEEISENQDYLEYQYNELNNANLKLHEDEEIIKELDILNNYEEVFDTLNNVKSSLTNNQVTEVLYDTLHAIKKLKNINDKYSTYYTDLENAYYTLDDLKSTLKDDLSNMEFDEDRLNELNERLSLLTRLQKKYKRNISGLIQYKEELLWSLNQVSNKDFILNDAKEEVIVKYNYLKKLALDLSKMRKAKVVVLKEGIINTLKDLMLDKVRLEIPFKEVKLEDPFDNFVFTQSGIDEIDFLISFNLGEELKPLAKCASGGEMSRVMLALKSHLFINKGLQTVIFDEIDTGISGKVADGVAIKLKNMSKYTQILAITHLPIVASLADNHLYVSKVVAAERTSTIVEELSLEQRIDKLAEMISPNDTSGKAHEVAKNMIKG